MSLYFSLLPAELLSSLLLYFSVFEIDEFLTEFNNIEEFNTLFSNNEYWRIIWKNKISSAYPVPVDANRQFLNTIDYIGYNPNIRKIIKYLIEHNYDILLLTEFIMGLGDFEIAIEYAVESDNTFMTDKLFPLFKVYKRSDSLYNYVIKSIAKKGNIDVLRSMLKS